MNPTARFLRWPSTDGARCVAAGTQAKGIARTSAGRRALLVEGEGGWEPARGAIWVRASVPTRRSGAQGAVIKRRPGLLPTSVYRVLLLALARGQHSADVKRGGTPTRIRRRTRQSGRGGPSPTTGGSRHSRSPPCAGCPHGTPSGSWLHQSYAVRPRLVIPRLDLAPTLQAAGVNPLRLRRKSQILLTSESGMDSEPYSRRQPTALRFPPAA